MSATRDERKFGLHDLDAEKMLEIVDDVPDACMAGLSCVAVDDGDLVALRTERLRMDLYFRLR